MSTVGLLRQVSRRNIARMKAAYEQDRADTAGGAAPASQGLEPGAQALPKPKPRAASDPKAAAKPRGAAQPKPKAQSVLGAVKDGKVVKKPQKRKAQK